MFLLFSELDSAEVLEELGCTRWRCRFLLVPCWTIGAEPDERTGTRRPPAGPLRLPLVGSRGFLLWRVCIDYGSLLVWKEIRNSLLNFVS